MWVSLSRCDDSEKVVFGRLDNEPVSEYDGKLNVGSELAVAYSCVREHRRQSDPPHA